MSSKHRLLERQLKTATSDGVIDIEKFLALVDSAYTDFDSMSKRTQRSLMLMSDELSITNETLRAETLRLRQFYDYAASSADIGLWEINVSENTIDCTNGFKNMVGYLDQSDETVMEYMSHCLSKRIIKEFRDKIYSPNRKSHQLIQIRAALQNSDNKTQWVLIQGSVVEHDLKTNLPLIIAGTLEDITQQVDHEQALEKLNLLSAEVHLSLEEKCNQALNTLRAVIGGDFIRINKLDINKLTVIYSSGTKPNQLLETKHIFSTSLCAKCIDSKTGTYCINNLADEGFANHPARKVMGVESYLGAVITVRGNIYGVLCLTGTTATQFTDLNKNLIKVAAHWFGGQIELAQSSDTLREAHASAVEASQAKSNFLATMSHEIRTPLNGIMGLVELLQESPADNIQKSQLTTMERSCSTLLTVISDILDFSKIEAGKFELEDAVFDITTVLRDVIGVFQALADEKDVELLVTCANNLPAYLQGDDNRLRQILNNLLSNALKFTHSGSVSLGVSANIDGDKPAITFVVQDTGIGMSPEQIDRAFDKFTQADSSTTRQYGGTGLGLAIVHQLITLMGGVINIASTLGTGTRVSLTLPFKQAAAKNFKGAMDEKNNSIDDINAKILVAEDNPVNQYVIKAMLESLGCTVTLAVNGLEALEHLETKHFDLVLMDMQMPEMDGVMATEHIRKKSATAKLPIIALTANVLASDRERCLKAGMNEFLLKPVKKHKLAKVLTKYIHS